MLSGSFSKTVAAVVALGLIQGVTGLAAVITPVAPTLTVHATPSQSDTNTVVLTDTTHDNVLVSNVLFEVNHSGAWSAATTPSNAFTNWTASVTLTAGSNAISLYAVNTNGQASRTNSVNIFYVETNVATFEKVGLGTISPNYTGKPLDIGRDYTVVATAEAGSRFTNWVETAGTNSTTVTTPRLTFQMQSNLVIVATFIDAEKPTFTISGPTSLRTSNTVLTLSGTAHDNVGVKAVGYQINGGAIGSAETANGFTNWTATLFLSPGANDIVLWAGDTSGNISATKTVRVTEEASGFAPESLNGLTLSSSQVTFLFGTNTYASVSNNFAAGNFTYNMTGSNTAEIATTPLAPSAATNSDLLSLTFTASGSGTFSSQSSGSGSFSLSGSSPSALATLDQVTLKGTSTSSYTYTNVFADGTSVLTDSSGNSYTPAYSYATVSSSAGVVVETFVNDGVATTNYTLLLFAPAGPFINNQYFTESANTNTTDTDTGTFSFTTATNKITDRTPAAIAGFTADVTQTKITTNTTAHGTTTVTTHDTFTVSFGEATFGQYDSNTNNGAGVGDYTFTRTSTNTASLNLTYLAPLTDVTNQNSSAVSLTFVNADTAFFTNQNSHGTLTLHRPATLVPISIAGKTLHAAFHGGGSAEGTFTGNTFALTVTPKTTPGESHTNVVIASLGGTYTFAQFGPQVALAQLAVTSGIVGPAPASGETDDLEFWFSTATSGNIIDTTTPPGTVQIGTFTLK